MPRGRLVVFGVVIALVSIALTALAILVVFPAVMTGSIQRIGEGGRTPGEGREVAFNPDELVKVVVALQRLPRGFTIPSDAYNNAVGVREWPAVSVPVDAIIVQPGQDEASVIADQVVGRIVRTDIEREQPILRAMLAESMTDLARQGSDIAAQLPAGTRAVSIPVNKLSSIGYGVQPGDRVDLIFSFLVVDVDEDFQSEMPNWAFQTQYGAFSEDGARSTAGITPQQGAIYGRIETIPPGELANIVPSEPQRPRLVTQRVISCAPVMYVGLASLDGEILGAANEQPSSSSQATPVAVSAERPDVVTLAVAPQEANVIRWAINAQVDIGLSLCAVQDSPDTQTSSVTMQYMFETYDVPNPPRLPYSLEPSLRRAPGE